MNRRPDTHDPADPVVLPVDEEVPAPIRRNIPGIADSGKGAQVNLASREAGGCADSTNCIPYPRQASSEREADPVLAYYICNRSGGANA